MRNEMPIELRNFCLNKGLYKELKRKCTLPYRYNKRMQRLHKLLWNYKRFLELKEKSKNSASWKEFEDAYRSYNKCDFHFSSDKSFCSLEMGEAVVNQEICLLHTYSVY